MAQATQNSEMVTSTRALAAFSSAKEYESIQRAFPGAQTPAEAQQAWFEVNKQVMEDAAIVPLITQSYTTYQSKRVHNALFLPAFQTYDYSLIWLS